MARKPGERAFAFSTMLRAKSNEPPQRQEMTWPEFVAGFTTPTVRREKDGLAWLPGLFRPGSKRHADNAEALASWGLDLDDGTVKRAAIAKALNGYTYLAHTTFSSRPGAERWRVVLPLSEPVAPSKAPALFDYFNEKFEGKLDPACKDASRLFYAAACPPGMEKHYRFFNRDGEVFDASKLPDAAHGKTKLTSVAPAAEIPVRFRDLLRTDGALRLRWEGDTDGLRDTSRSGLDMALTALLAHRAFTDAEIFAILIEFSHGKADERSGKYVARMIAKARQHGDAKAEPTDGAVVYRSVADIRAEPVIWLWSQRIARGKPSLIVGDPGLGKSQLTVSLAAIVSSGGAFPDGTKAERGNVVILSA
jgi:hypothetical protein